MLWDAKKVKVPGKRTREDGKTGTCFQKSGDVQ